MGRGLMALTGSGIVPGPGPLRAQQSSRRCDDASARFGPARGALAQEHAHAIGNTHRLVHAAVPEHRRIPAHTELRSTQAIPYARQTNPTLAHTTDADGSRRNSMAGSSGVDR